MSTISSINVNGTSYKIKGFDFNLVENNTPQQLDEFNIIYLTEEEYQSKLEAGTLDETAMYCTDFSAEEGSSLPSGGTTGQVLAKNSDVDGDVSWQNLNISGLENPHLIFKNLTIPANSFIEDSTLTLYPYRAAVSCQGVLETMFPIVSFSENTLNLGILSSIVCSYNGGLYIYANNIPTEDINILSAIFLKN